MCSMTASISGRASGVALTCTCQPACTPMDLSTSRRAYSSTRGSRTNEISNARADGRQPPIELLEGAQELFDLERRERLDPDRPARAQCHGHLRHRRDVGRVDDVHEVELPQRRPLVQHAAAELLDVLVDLAKTLRVRLERRASLPRRRRPEAEHGHPGDPTLAA